MNLTIGFNLLWCSRGLKRKSQLLLACQYHLREHFQGRSGMKDMQITGAKTNNTNLLDWIETIAQLCKPDSIYLCDGSQEEYDDLDRVADVEWRRRLRSASTAALIVPVTARSTIGDRAFTVAAAQAWNCLPFAVTSSASISVFRDRLKTELFKRSFPFPS